MSSCGDPTDCNSSGSSVHGISQTRVLEWVATSFSRGSSQPRDLTQVSNIAGRFFINWATGEQTIVPGWGTWTAEIKFLTVLVAESLRSRCQQYRLLLRPLSLACRQPPSFCVLTQPFLCAHPSAVSLCVSRASFLIKTPVRLGYNAPCRPHFNFTTSLKAPSASTDSHIRRHWGLGLLQILFLGGAEFRPKQ